MTNFFGFYDDGDYSNLLTLEEWNFILEYREDPENPEKAVLKLLGLSDNEDNPDEKKERNNFGC